MSTVLAALLRATSNGREVIIHTTAHQCIRVEVKYRRHGQIIMAIQEHLIYDLERSLMGEDEALAYVLEAALADLKRAEHAHREGYDLGSAGR